MSKVNYYSAEIDGKRVTYSSKTVFKIQISKGKGTYKTRYSFTGNLVQAMLHYNGVNVIAPYKKRLFTGEGIVLARRAG
jgi:hypothetical protein